MKCKLIKGNAKKCMNRVTNGKEYCRIHGKKDYPKRDRKKPDKIVEFYNTHHPCRRCKGYVPDGAIICIHCKEGGKETGDP